MYDITQVQKVGFANGLTHALQQKKSKLEGLVRVVEQTGKETSVDRIGAAKPVKKKGRYPATPYIPTPFDRRWIMSDMYHWADLVDDDDKLRMIDDPTSDLALAAERGMQRIKDDVIIEAAWADVPAGEKSTDGVVSFPPTQIIPNAAAGLTFDKINLAREMLDEAQVDEDDPRIWVCTAQQITNLLNEPKATNADYTTVRHIQEGKFEGTWMGFLWITVPAAKLPKIGQTRMNLAYTKSSLCMCKPKDITSKIDQLPERSYVTQLYAEMRIGACRTEEQGVLKIEVQERA